MRIVVGPWRLCHAPGRDVAERSSPRCKGEHRQEPAEPVVFRGSIGIPQFSSDGQRLLILSGATWNAFDSIRLIDLSPLYRQRETALENFEEKPAPPWLADIASAVSAFDPSGDGALLH